MAVQTTGENTSKCVSIRTKMKELIPEYKVLYLYWLYSPDLLPAESKIKTFEELKNHFKMFPNGVTEESAKVWLYEEPVQNALKLLLKAKQSQRMVELYNIYFVKAKDDVQAFKAFVDFSNTFFHNDGESELQSILNNVDIDE